MNHQDLTYFIEVATSGSITRASERLGMTQPALSLSIKRLEEAIGTQLIHRFKTGIKLTAAGKQLITYSHQLIDLWDKIKQSANESNQEIKGHFKIGCHPSVAINHLPASFSKLLHDYPALKIQFVSGLSRHITEAVISMKVDLGIVVNPIKHPDLILIPLWQDMVGLWHNLSEQYLEKHCTLLCDPELKQSSAILQQLKSKAFNYERIIESDNLEMLAKLAMDKVGVAIIPASIAKKHTSLVNIHSDIHFKDEIYIALRHENRFIKAIQAIIESLKNS